MCTPSAPAATPARAQGGIRSGRPVAWLGSTMIGRCDKALQAGTAATSNKLRVAVSKPFTPRSQSTTLGLPCERMYSALIKRSTIVALMPRFNRIGLRVLPTSVSSTKFCMLRAPI